MLRRDSVVKIDIITELNILSLLKIACIQIRTQAAKWCFRRRMLLSLFEDSGQWRHAGVSKEIMLRRND